MAQHRAPSPNGQLVALLARTTSLKVVTSSRQTALEAGTVMVAESNVEFSSDLRSLRPSAPSAGPGPAPSIDVLMSSAAATWAARAVGVILSGTGRDGAAGLQEIRAAGGVTIAQSPHTAAFPAMPQAAIDGGAVETVLLVAEIGPLLRNLLAGGRPDVVPAGPPGQGLDEVAIALRSRSGVDLTGHKRGTLRRQVKRRMVATGTVDVPAYAALLRADAEEARVLTSALLVNVTSFFRDPEAWAGLETELGALISEANPRHQFRIWVPGCATGEEPYTVGMIAAGLLGDPADLTQRLKIFATDLSEQALAVGRRVRYPQAAARLIPARHHARWLRTSEPDVEPDVEPSIEPDIEVDPGLRECFVFARHNLALDPPFPKVDLICLRNTLICFEAPLQERVTRLLHGGLRPGGLLMLGRSERILDPGNLFEAVEADNRIYRRRPGPTPGAGSARRPGGQAAPVLSKTSIARPTSVGLAVPTRPDRSGDGRDDLLDDLVRRFAPPCLVLDAEDGVIEVVGDVSAWCRVALGRRSSQATTLLREELRPAARSLLLQVRHGDADAPSRTVALAGGNVTVRVSRLGAETGRVVLSFIEDSDAERSLGEPSGAGSDELAQLTADLASTEAALQVSIEELGTSNEELQALNEELQAGAEELQASSEEVQAMNEELEASNEELSTVNSQLRLRGDDLASANSDLENVQSSLSSGLILVDNQLRVTRFTPPAVRIFALIEADIGRGLPTIPSLIDIPGLEQRLRATVELEEPGTLEVHGDHIDFLLHFEPYRATDGTVNGVVVVTNDITDLTEAHRRAQRALEDLVAMTEALPEAVWRREVDGRVSFANSRVESLFGLRRKRILAEPGLLLAAVHPDDRDWVAEATDSRATDGYRIEYRILHPNGQIRWIHETGRLVPGDYDGPEHLVASALDGTDSHETAGQVHNRLATLEAVFENTVFGVVILDEQHKIVRANHWFVWLCGYDEQTLIGMPLELLIADARGSANEQGAPHEGPVMPGVFGPGVSHQRLVSHSGAQHFVTVESRSLPAKDGPAGRIVIVHDVSQLHRANSELTSQARFDQQTGLLARSHFRALLVEELARADRTGAAFAVLWIDLDGFKEINDHYGHRAGDAVLLEVARRLQRSGRRQDVVGRLGGDEFAMLVTDVNGADNLESVTQRILDLLREPVVLKDSQVFLTGSMGVALAPEDGLEADVLLHNADTAMYSAKQAGRDRRVYFQAEMNQAAEDRADTSHHLAAALRAREFVMHYQPILEPVTGRVHSVEALVRWERDGRVIPAAEFLGLAEQTGQLRAIGRVVLELIDLDLPRLDADLGPQPADLPGSALLQVCINLSPAQLDDRDLIERLLAWEPSGGHQRITIEVTEGASLAREGRPMDTLAILRRLGARLSIDDFGTGYSNLALLDRLRPGTIKIDRSLLLRAQEQPRGASVLHAAIQLAHAIEAEVVVEGVEDVELLTLAQTLGVEGAQGYHLAMPMPRDELVDWVRARWAATS